MDQNNSETQSTAVNAAAIPTTIPNSPVERNLRSLYEYEDKFDKGYDSDGRIAPFWECLEEEGKQDYDENDLAEVGIDELDDADIDADVIEALSESPTTQAEEKIVESELPINVHVPISDDVLKSLKVQDLKLELRMCGQPLTGNKPVLLRIS